MRLRASVVLLAVLVLVVGSARADVGPPPDECAQKKPGAPCKDPSGKAGACGTIAYTRTFQPPTPGAAPEVSQRTYFGCKAGETPLPSGGKACSVVVAGAAGAAAPAVCAAALLALAAVRRRRW